MGNKIYKVALEKDEEVEKYFQKCCLSYHKIFNNALDIQQDAIFHGLTHEKQLMKFEDLLEKIEEVQSSKKIEKGIIEKATESSYSYFQKWWNARMLDTKGVMKSLPSYMRKTNTFKTSTILKVSKGGFVYFPKFRRVKLTKSNYVPLGSYKNAKVIREGKIWYISLEAVEKTQGEKHDLSGILEVHISPTGDVSFRDKVYPNVIGKENYKEAEAKQQKLIKSLKKKLEANSYIDDNGEKVVNFSNSMKLTKQKIESSYYKMRNIKIEYFRQIVKDILKQEPEVLKFVYDSEFGEKTQFTSRLFKKSSTWDLVKMIRYRMSSIGTEITYSDSIKEEVYKKLKYLQNK